MKLEVGSMEHTRYSYNYLKKECKNDVRVLMEYLSYLQSAKKINHLVDMPGLTNFEITLINSYLEEE